MKTNARKHEIAGNKESNNFNPITVSHPVTGVKTFSQAVY
jgi:hypothetical protein